MKEVIRIEKRYTSLLADSGVNRILLAAWVTLMLLMPTSCNTAEEETFMPFEQTFREAEGARLSGRYEEAIRLYKTLLNDCTASEHARHEKVQKLLPKVMVQLLNTYQSQGRPEACVAFFDSLRSEADGQKGKEEKVLGTLFRRDVYVLLSYAV